MLLQSLLSKNLHLKAKVNKKTKLIGFNTRSISEVNLFYKKYSIQLKLMLLIIIFLFDNIIFDKQIEQCCSCFISTYAVVSLQSWFTFKCFELKILADLKYAVACKSLKPNVEDSR